MNTGEIEGSGSADQITLKAKLDLTASEELVDELKARRGRDVILDASGVEHFGAHAMQTLMIAAQSWRTDGHRFTVTDLSAAATEHLAHMGLDHTIFDGEGINP